ncbi:MAG: hypothetical protein BYD32DRAFT_430753 [Podila humilis]|nr:MAG: hypothetical protein BYD32DRAFT_430753 [Podila humilis]
MSNRSRGTEWPQTGYGLAKHRGTDRGSHTHTLSECNYNLDRDRLSFITCQVPFSCSLSLFFFLPPVLDKAPFEIILPTAHVTHCPLAIALCIVYNLLAPFFIFVLY